MASLFLDPRGYNVIQFRDTTGKKRWVRVPKMRGNAAAELAAQLKLDIEHVLLNQAEGLLPADLVADRLGKLQKRHVKLYDRLAIAGIVPQRAAAVAKPEAPASPLLGAYFDAYIAMRTDLKPNTLETFRQTRKALRALAEMPIDRITAGDCTDWLTDLHGDYAGATRSTYVRRVRQVLSYALDKDLITKNPMAKVKAGKMTNKATQAYIDVATIDRVLEFAPDHEWRLIIALARFGGLRTPSETFALKLTDVDWANRILTIHSPKLERNEGGGVRLLPIPDKLMTYLEDTYHAAPVGQVYFIQQHRGDNLRTQFERIIRKAGVPKWKRLFHNLRASCQTDITVGLGNVAAACKFLGNSPAVANASYNQARPEDTVKMRSVFGPAQQKVQHSDQAKALAKCDTAEQVESNDTQNTSDFEGLRSDSETCDAAEYPREGAHIAPAIQAQAIAVQTSCDGRGFAPAARALNFAQHDPDLARIIALWPTLPNGVRASIVELATCGERQSDC